MDGHPFSDKSGGPSELRHSLIEVSNDRDRNKMKKEMTMDYIPFPSDGTDFQQWVAMAPSDDLIQAQVDYFVIIDETTQLGSSNSDFTDPGFLDEINNPICDLYELAPWVLQIHLELCRRYNAMGEEGGTGEPAKSTN